MYCFILGSCFYFSIPFVVYPSPTSVHQLPSSFSTLLAINNADEGERFDNNINSDENNSMIELNPAYNNPCSVHRSFLSPLHAIDVDISCEGSSIQSAADVPIMEQGSSYNISNTVQLLPPYASSLVTSNNEASFRIEQEEINTRGSRFSGMQILIVDGNQEASLL